MIGHSKHDKIEKILAENRTLSDLNLAIIASHLADIYQHETFNQRITARLKELQSQRGREGEKPSSDCTQSVVTTEKGVLTKGDMGPSKPVTKKGIPSTTPQ